MFVKTARAAVAVLVSDLRAVFNVHVVSIATPFVVAVANLIVRQFNTTGTLPDAKAFEAAIVTAAAVLIANYTKTLVPPKTPKP